MEFFFGVIYIVFGIVLLLAFNGVCKDVKAIRHEVEAMRTVQASGQAQIVKSIGSLAGRPEGL